MIINAQSIQKTYFEHNESLPILRDVNLQAEKGDLIAIMGASGSGKSTLMHILGLLDNADSGTIEFFGKALPTGKQDFAHFRNQHIGFVFQFHYLLEDFTALENIAIPYFIATKNWKKSMQEAKKLLALFELEAREKHYPNQLSGGEQQRIAIARAVINKPEILLLDEPTGNLDKTHAQQCMNLLLSLHNQFEHTILMVTHSEDLASQMNSQYRLHEGILVPTL